jgi:hypothetical protein
VRDGSSGRSGFWVPLVVVALIGLALLGIYMACAILEFPEKLPLT